MRRTLLTVAAFLACAFGVGTAADELLDTTPAHTGSSTVLELGVTDHAEPVGRAR